MNHPVWRSTPLGFVQGNETKIFSHHDAACELNKFDVTWVHPKIHGNLRGPPQEIYSWPGLN